MNNDEYFSFDWLRRKRFQTLGGLLRPHGLADKLHDRRVIRIPTLIGGLSGLAKLTSHLLAPPGPQQLLD